MIKNLKICTLIACSLIIGAACSSDTEPDTTPAPDKKPEQPQIGETITYRAQVWAEKNDIVVWRRASIQTKFGNHVS